MWPFLEIESSTEGTQLKWDRLSPDPVQLVSFWEEENLNIETYTEEDAVKRHREMVAIYKPEPEAWGRSLPHSPPEGPPSHLQDVVCSPGESHNDPHQNLWASSQRWHTVWGCAFHQSLLSQALPVLLGSHNKMPHTGWLRQQRFVFSHDWGLGIHDQGVSNFRSSEASVLTASGQPSVCERLCPHLL